jgi:type IV secretion system protein TrbG
LRVLYAEPDKTLAGVANFLSDPRRPIETTLRAMMTTPQPHPVRIVEIPKLLPLPGQLKPIPGAKTEETEAADPRARVEQANGEARVQPTRAGYINAIQGYPFSDGAL